MIYGMYLSATGVLTNSYRQDIIANNLANSETIGFKKDLAMQRERRNASVENPFARQFASQLTSDYTGGTLVEPTAVDVSQGEMEETGNAMDVAIQGSGFLGVSHNGKTELTRNGQMVVGRDGYVVLSNDESARILDDHGSPIQLNRTQALTIDNQGAIGQQGKTVARLGIFDVADPSHLKKEGQTLLSFGNQALKPVEGSVRSGFVERANVDPATEMAQLMETQRQLEANANMIRAQDQTLGLLVNTVGKVG